MSSDYFSSSTAPPLINRRRFARLLLAQSPADNAAAKGEALPRAPRMEEAEKSPSTDAKATPLAERSPDEKKKVAVSVGSLLIGGILLLGLLLLVMVFLLGQRTRRITAERGPAANPPDPLWYLRKKNSQPPTDKLSPPGETADDV